MIEAKLLLRFSAGKQIGLGHFFRCLAVVEAALKENVACVLATESPDLIEQFIPSEVSVLKIPMGLSELDDALFCKESTTGIIAVLLDSYELGSDWESGWPQETSLAVVDDDPRRHKDQALILNYNPWITESHYSSQNSPLLLNLDYLLIRDQFRKSVEFPSKKLLINFGGTDPKDYTKKVLGALVDQGLLNLSVTILAQPSNEISDLSRYFDEVTFIHCCLDMAELYQEHQLVLGAAGVSAWERMACNVPSIVWQVADNQAQNIQWLRSCSEVKVAEGEPDKELDWITTLLAWLESPPEISYEIDNKGPFRLLAALLKKSATSHA